MVVIVARHVVRPEIAREFPRLFEDFSAATRAEPGNITFEWSRSADDPQVYYLVEVFRDEAASAAHVASEHFRAAVGRMPGCLVLCRSQAPTP